MQVTFYRDKVRAIVRTFDKILIHAFCNGYEDDILEEELEVCQDLTNKVVKSIRNGCVINDIVAILEEGSSAYEHFYINFPNSKAKKIAEQLSTAGAQCRAISAKADLFIRLLGRASQYFSPLVSRLAAIAEKEGFDYASYSPESKKAVAAAYSMALTVKAIIDTPILTRSGGIDPKCDLAAKKVSAALLCR